MKCSKRKTTNLFLIQINTCRKENPFLKVYFECRDSQNTLISQYISTDKTLVAPEKLFFYYLFPNFVNSFLPNPENFPTYLITPDLSKEYDGDEETYKKKIVKREVNRFLSTINCVTPEDNMLIIWVILWSMCFKFIYQDEEKYFRVDQLCGVLVKWLSNNREFRQRLSLFEDLLRCLLEYGDLKMVTQVLLVMNYLGIKRNSTIDNLFFMAIRKKREQLKKKEKREEKKNEHAKPAKISDLIAEMEKRRVTKKMLSKWEGSLDCFSPITLKAKAIFYRRTFKGFKDIHNFMVKDIITLSIDSKCQNCRQKHSWEDLRREEQNEGFGMTCQNCEEALMNTLEVVIGDNSDSLGKITNAQNNIYETQSFLRVRDLRMHINELYNTRLDPKVTEIFDLMIFREMSKQLFWNCIFHMIQYKMPYDFVLPYEGIGLLQNLKMVNKHIYISVPENEEFQTPIRERRHKSDIDNLVKLEM